MTSVARIDLRVVMMVVGFSMAALADAGCVTDGAEDEDILWDEREDDLDEDEAAEGESGGDTEGAVPLICIPEEIDGSVVRLALDSTGAMRARGAVWSNVAPCNVSVYTELRRDGTRIDSQQKSCGDESCKSRLLSAGNPAGNQTFCLSVRQTSTGTLLARQCKIR